MRFLRIIIFLYCFISCLYGEPVPLLLWGEETPELPALYTMHPYELQQIIFNLLDTHMIVLFVENDLTTKDFLCINPATNDSCFHYIRTMEKLNYYTQVHNPIETIEAFVSDPPIKWRPLDLELPHRKPFSCRVGEVLGFEFLDEYNTRTERIIAHDAIIAEFSWSLDCPLVQIYTTRRKWNQRRRLSLYDLYLTNKQAKKEASVERKPSRRSGGPKPYRPKLDIVEYIFVSNYFVIRYQFVHLIRSESNEKFGYFAGPHHKAIKPKTNDMKEMITISGIHSKKMDNPNFGFTVSFDSTPTALALDLWTFQNYKGVRYRTLTGDSKGYAMMPFNVPDNKSYCCSLLEAFATDKSRIQFENIQMQALRSGRNTSDKFAFGDPVYCTGALTPNIMAGLLIAVLMVFIGGFGLLWILDIGSNAYMDDPNGPDLQFKARD